MEAVFGWTLLSADAIRRAEARLREEAEGVRDEVGFMLLHQGYADRFFPGTSVQHTRLRYVLFVPWIYQRIADMDLQYRRQHSIEKLLAEQEVKLTGRLLLKESEGVIGRRVYAQRRPSSQPATLVYWTALSAWGLLRRLDDGSMPSRAGVHQILSSDWRPIRIHDDDGVPIQEGYSIFSNIPSPPDSWNDQSKPVTFQLRASEARFIKGQMLTTRKPHTLTPSLLAELSRQPQEVQSAPFPWHRRIGGLADAEDQVALQRAKRAASLAAIGRGIYAALVEQLREKRDGLATSDKHRFLLDEVVRQHRENALELEVRALLEDVPRLPSFFVTVLLNTQEWLRNGGAIDSLCEIYECAEKRRKGDRARLVLTPAGRQKRTEWDNEKHPTAKPLHYRWPIVRQMLADLGAHA